MIRPSQRILLTVAIVIPLCVFVVMVPYSLLIGWSLVTAFIFWFFIVPALVFLLCDKLLKEKKSHLIEMSAMISFYALTFFMIYEHTQTDFSSVKVVSFVYNLLVMSLVMVVEAFGKPKGHMGPH